MTATTFKIVPLDRVKESPLNPRKIFREGPLQELAESIRAKGVLTPLLVRPTAGGEYELAAGHRRRRASERAGVTEVPVLIREMSDEDFLEVLTVDNLQREDVEPLDEAEGFRALIDLWRAKREAIGAKGGYKDDVARVAERIGKSVSHVYSRLKLLDLNPRGRQYLQDGVITAGHAIILARLQPADQDRALEYLVCGADDEDLGGEEPECVESVRDFGDWVKYSLQCRLSGAPFQLLDSKLGGGACTTCSKRAGYLDGVKAKDDLCMDRSCYAAKCQAYVQRQLALDPGLLKLSYEYSPPEKDLFGTKSVLKEAAGQLPCAREAIYVSGPAVGSVAKVCGLGNDCPTHGRQLSGNVVDGEWEKRQKRAAAETARRQQLLRAIVERLSTLPPKGLLVEVAVALWAHSYHKRAVAFLWGWSVNDEKAAEDAIRNTSEEVLWGLLTSLAVAGEIEVHAHMNQYPPARGLQGIADLLGVEPPASKPNKSTAKAAVQTSAKEGKKR